MACSDGRPLKYKDKLKQLETVLSEMDLGVEWASTIYQQKESPFSGTPKERADELMRLFTSDHVKVIFDISGGDAANQILPYLDFDAIRKHPKWFVGMSDLSVVNNALLTCAGLPTVHYAITTLIGQHAEGQREWFINAFMQETDVLKQTDFSYQWLRGESMEGVVVGGNLRCFLKLSGTRYFPELNHKILFLEALGGKTARMASMLSQLEQIGAFSACKGILLGTFSEMQQTEQKPTIEELVHHITEKYYLPIAKTERLGHGSDAIGIPIGLNLAF
ncbi:LD-carboxypeptidase [Terrilactibacillus sp. BCM23-1]|uniref:LD-carboxypeptidase n=2 Tax=Terrilactibacillus tamarindi TaxID=2599694 RepID=A0A6N8CPH1_9BACI|nr:LD-carboxypeptidase [Terrilactibacillus tamarindi]